MRLTWKNNPHILLFIINCTLLPSRNVRKWVTKPRKGRWMHWHHNAAVGESGWTLYLEHSFQLNHNAFSHASSQFIGEDNDEYKDKKAKKEEAEEEDLSMVSDASSGPPHLPDAQDNGSFYSASNSAKLGKRSRKRQKVKQYQHLPSFLDDTASSVVFDFNMVSLILLGVNCIALWPHLFQSPSPI